MLRFHTLARQTSALGSVLVFAAARMVPTLVATTPVLARDPIIRDHRTAPRLEVVVNRVHIFDDHDWGEGEIRLQLAIAHPTDCFIGATAVLAPGGLSCRVSIWPVRCAQRSLWPSQPQ